MVDNCVRIRLHCLKVLRAELWKSADAQGAFVFIAACQRISGRRETVAKQLDRQASIVITRKTVRIDDGNKEIAPAAARKSIQEEGRSVDDKWPLIAKVISTRPFY